MPRAATAPADDAPHLLVVDDDRRIRDLLSRFLAQEGYRLSTAESAAQARAKLNGLRFDLLILDVMMPGESGFDLARRLAGEPPRERPRVLLISTHPEAEFADLIEASPAVGFLPKSELSASAISTTLAAGRDGDGPVAA